MFTQMGTSGNLPFCPFFSFFIPFIPLFPPLYSLSLSSPVLFPPPSPSLIPPVPFMCLFPVLFPEVSWCSRLSHHFYVVRVPGSNPGGTIFMLPSLLSYPILFLSLPFFFLLYPLLYPPFPPFTYPLHLPFFFFFIGRFISSRIHPFPSEHGSKDA